MFTKTMAKNNSLIAQYKYLYRKASDITPSVYASIAIPLVEKYGWSGDEVEDLFQMSQDIWQENATDRMTMLEKCLELTGIDLRTSDV